MVIAVATKTIDSRGIVADISAEIEQREDQDDDDGQNGGRRVALL